MGQYAINWCMIGLLIENKGCLDVDMNRWLYTMIRKTIKFYLMLVCFRRKQLGTKIRILFCSHLFSNFIK